MHEKLKVFYGAGSDNELLDALADEIIKYQWIINPAIHAQLLAYLESILPGVPANFVAREIDISQDRIHISLILYKSYRHDEGCCSFDLQYHRGWDVFYWIMNNDIKLGTEDFAPIHKGMEHIAECIQSMKTNLIHIKELYCQLTE